MLLSHLALVNEKNEVIVIIKCQRKCEDLCCLWFLWSLLSLSVCMFTVHNILVLVRFGCISSLFILYYAIKQQKKHKNSKYINLKLVHLYTHSTHIICKN